MNATIILPPHFITNICVKQCRKRKLPQWRAQAIMKIPQYMTNYLRMLQGFSMNLSRFWFYENLQKNPYLVVTSHVTMVNFEKKCAKNQCIFFCIIRYNTSQLTYKALVSKYLIPIILNLSPLDFKKASKFLDEDKQLRPQ